MELTKELLKQYDENFDKNGKNLIAMNAASSCGVDKAAQNYSVTRNIPHEFSVSISKFGTTNQKNSGRCWLFAATNCLRYQLMKKYNIEEFELSQNFLLFYDKLEKANYFLESMIELADEPVTGRTVSFLLKEPEGDGGQWDMFCNIVRKYGIVPKAAMPETACSSKTSEMGDYLTEKLRQCACTLRNAHNAGKSAAELEKMKESMMEDVYRLLCICLGKPPLKFDFEVRTKDDKYITDYGITPKEFYDKHIGIDLDDYVSLINATTDDKPFNKSYTVKYLGNVKEGHIIRYLNLDIEELKKAAIAQMKDGEPVWFGCDVGQRELRDFGILDLDTFDIEELFSMDFDMTKAQRLDYGESQMSHAMVLQGVNILPDGTPNRWRVENSWGDDVGKKGYFVMGDKWFSQYVYQVVVNKKYLTATQLAQYESEPKVLEPWDPMGSLAMTK